jgi:hypothetical protein
LRIANPWKLVHCAANHSTTPCPGTVPLANLEHYSTTGKDHVTRRVVLFHQNQNSLSHSACLSSRHCADLTFFSETVAYCLVRESCGISVPNSPHCLYSGQSAIVEEPYPASRCPRQKLVSSTNNTGIIGGSIVCGLPIPGWEAANRFGPIQ